MKDVNFELEIRTRDRDNWESVKKFYRYNEMYIEIVASGESGIDYMYSYHYNKEEFESRLKSIISDYIWDVSESAQEYEVNNKYADFIEFEVKTDYDGTFINEYDNMLQINLIDESILDGIPEIQKVIKILTTEGKAALELELWEDKN
jgi:hypothetical protein